MRLNGRATIMRYLGKPLRSNRAWYSILLRYGAVIRVNYPRIKTGMRGYWCQSGDLDAVDKALSVSAWEAHGKEKLIDYVTTLHTRCQNAKRRGLIR